MTGGLVTIDKHVKCAVVISVVPKPASYRFGATSDPDEESLVVRAEKARDSGETIHLFHLDGCLRRITTFTPTTELANAVYSEETHWLRLETPRGLLEASVTSNGMDIHSVDGATIDDQPLEVHLEEVP